jgi:hypothetical protein
MTGAPSARNTREGHPHCASGDTRGAQRILTALESSARRTTRGLDPEVWRVVADRLMSRRSQSVLRVDLRLVGTRSR